jgi:hypothetical protein
MIKAVGKDEKIGEEQLTEGPCTTPGGIGFMLKADKKPLMGSS